MTGGRLSQFQQRLARPVRQARTIAAVGLLAAATALAEGSDVQQAQGALHRGDYEQAADLFRSLASQHSGSAEVWHNLGIALHLQGKSTEAIEAFRTAIGIAETPGTLALLGLNYCRVGDYASARPLLQRAREEFDDLRALAVLGPCYLETGDPLDAVEVYHRLVASELPPMDANQVTLARAYFRAAQQLTNKLESLEGGERFHKVLRAAGKGSGGDPRSAFGDAFKAVAGLRSAMSIEELSQLYRERDDSPALVYLLAVLLGERAMESFMVAAKEFRGSPHVRRLTAEMHAWQGNLEAAIAEYVSILDMGRAPPGLHYDLAVLYRDRAQWTAALEHFERELEVSPFETRAIRGVSDCLSRLGREDENRDYLLRLAGDGPIPAWALLQLGAIEQRSGRLEAAATYLERAVREHPEMPESHYRLGRLYLRMGRRTEAQRELEIFRELGAGNADSKAAVAAE